VRHHIPAVDILLTVVELIDCCWFGWILSCSWRERKLFTWKPWPQTGNDVTEHDSSPDFGCSGECQSSKARNVEGLCLPHQLCRRQKCKCTSKSSYLLKIPENLGKMPENPGKNGAQHLQKNTLQFFWRSHQKKVLMVFVGENLWTKGAQNFFGQVLGDSSKNPSHPQKLICSYTYVAHTWEERPAELFEASWKANPRGSLVLIAVLCWMAIKLTCEGKTNILCEMTWHGQVHLMISILAEACRQEEITD